jgi:carbonic anhydrase/acetyltransferase-like protein (isoleucine patch superfamily)
MNARHDPVKMNWNIWLFVLLLGATVHLRGADGQLWLNDRLHNPKRGGWVESTAYVAQSAYIGPEAKVLGSASVRGGARIYGRAVISGEATVDGRVAETGYSDSVASVYGNAQVNGSAVVKEWALIYGNAVVTDNARVENSASVFQDAQVNGSAIIRDSAIVSGNAIVGGNAVIGGTAMVRGYAQVFSGVITNGIVETQPPQAANTATPQQVQSNAGQTETQKTKQLRDFYARVNKDFANTPRNFQYSDGVLMGDYGIDSVWDTSKYDVIMKEPEFTVTTTATANPRQGDPITKSATTDNFKLGDIEGLKLDERTGKLTITLDHPIHTAYPDFESTWSSNDVSWQVTVIEGTSRDVVLSRNSRFDLNRVAVDKQDISRLRALHDFLKGAVDEYRKLTGRKPGSRVLE